MTTIPSLAKNTVTLFRLFSTTPIKWAKKAQAPIVRGFRPNSPSAHKSSSYLDMDDLRNVDPIRVGSHNSARTAAPLPPVATRPTPIKVQLIEVRQPASGSWLHDAWMPGHVSARIAAFEQLAAPQPKTKRQAPMPPSGSVPQPAKTTTSIPKQTLERSISGPRQTVAPPLPPSAHADASNRLGRSNSYPPTAQDRKPLFAELVKHPLLRSRETPESTREASEEGPISSIRQNATPSLNDGSLNPLQLALKKRVQMLERVAPIEVKPEVQRQAEELRARREAERAAAMREFLGTRSEPATPEFGNSKDLIAELKEVLSARVTINRSA